MPNQCTRRRCFHSVMVGTVSLPDFQPSVKSSTGDSRSGLALKDRTILIVANDQSKVRSLTDILRPEGYLVTTVDSGEASLNYSRQNEPDLILLDVDLPSTPVFEMCRFLSKRRQGRATVAVIFIASKSDPELVVEGLAAGGVDYFFRPFREQEVVARVRVHLLNRLRLAQLSREDSAKTRLLCMAAHDLRNPLVSIRAFTHLLRTGTVGEVTPEQIDFLDAIYDASQSGLDLVNELLDVSTIETGELKFTLTPGSLAALVSSAIKLNNATAAQKGSTIVLEPSSLLPELALDGPKVRQVLNNLLDNAIKFSPPNSTITVVIELTPNHCSVAVRDKGPGIPKNEYARLFKDFSRTSVKPTGGESSTGLGLSICFKIMQAHAGSIQAKNLPDGGEFRISFPLPL